MTKKSAYNTAYYRKIREEDLEGLHARKHTEGAIYRLVLADKKRVDDTRYGENTKEEEGYTYYIQAVRRQVYRSTETQPTQRFKCAQADFEEKGQGQAQVPSSHLQKGINLPISSQPTQQWRTMQGIGGCCRDYRGCWHCQHHERYHK